jgi:hypothetical protein
MRRFATAGTAVLATLAISTTPGYANELIGAESQVGSGAVAATGVLTAPGPESATVPALPRPGTVFYLSEKKSKAIVAALLSGGSGAGIAMCQTLVPPEFIQACSAIIGTLAAALGPFATPQAGYCIRIAVRLGVPPVSVSYAPCPQPHKPDEDTYSYEPPNPNPPLGGNAPAPGRGGVVVPGPGGVGVLVP